MTTRRALDPALALLTAHSPHWQALSVTYEGACTARLAAVQHRLPCLESFRLWDNTSVLDIFGDTPALRVVG
ncbi:hypothetical protein C8R44DRAFT_882566 [Mycena epipterygia]|nr:hypothetical protein C8R44DRAFT_882566 [Mycena epipterygia]